MFCSILPSDMYRVYLRPDSGGWCAVHFQLTRPYQRLRGESKTRLLTLSTVSFPKMKPYRIYFNNLS